MRWVVTDDVRAKMKHARCPHDFLHEGTTGDDAIWRCFVHDGKEL